MNVKDLIDDLLNYDDGVGASDGDNADRRQRALRWLRQVYHYVWGYRPWEWTYKESTGLTIASAANSTNLPTDFLEFSRTGLLHDTDRRIPLRWKSRYLIERYRREYSGGYNATVFAVWGGKIQIPYTAPSTINLMMFYRFKPEDINDETDATALVLPDRYAATVIAPALRYKSQVSKQDARDNWGGEFRDGLSQMVGFEFPEKASIRRMPLAVRGGW